MRSVIQSCVPEGFPSGLRLFLKETAPNRPFFVLRASDGVVVALVLGCIGRASSGQLGFLPYSGSEVAILLTLFVRFRPHARAKGSWRGAQPKPKGTDVGFH